jgi:hypothetical protein
MKTKETKISKKIFFIAFMLPLIALLIFLLRVPSVHFLLNKQTKQYDQIFELGNCFKIIYYTGELAFVSWIIIFVFAIFSFITAFVPKFRINPDVYFDIFRSVFILFTAFGVIGEVSGIFNCVASGKILYLNLSIIQIFYIYLLGSVFLLLIISFYCHCCDITPQFDRLYIASIIFTILSASSILILIPCLLQLPSL